MASVIEDLVFPARYNGPPGSANGGYAAGSLAHCLAPDPVEDAVTVSVRLSQPPPLDTPMHVNATDEGVSLTFGGAVVATARLEDIDLDPVEPVSYDVATEAARHYPGFEEHPFPGCFSCGPEHPTGLHIFPGPVDPIDGQMRVAAPWIPREAERADWHELHDPDPRTCAASTWSALDCVGAWAGSISPDRPMVLGTMTAHLEALPVVGEPHVVMGRAVAQEGRRTTTASTIYDADGRIVGVARHVWITVDPATWTAS